MTYDIQSSTTLVEWSADSSVTITNLNGTATIPVPEAQSELQKFYRAVHR